MDVAENNASGHWFSLQNWHVGKFILVMQSMHISIQLYQIQKQQKAAASKDDGKKTYKQLNAS